MLRIAYALRVMPTESIRPLQDVWLRPRRVFRELADAPVGLVERVAVYSIMAWQVFSAFVLLTRPTVRDG